MSELDTKVTRAVRAADLAFAESGGSSRHWVQECFIPALAKEGLAIVVVPVEGLKPGRVYLDPLNREVVLDRIEGEMAVVHLSGSYSATCHYPVSCLREVPPCE